MVDAVRCAGSIDPYACRAHVAANFAPAIMTDAYVRMYDTIIGRRGTSPFDTSWDEAAAPAQDDDTKATAAVA
jgi:hypothetical protein